MFEMAEIKVPVIAIVIGEGSSGGALALCVADRIFMLENAIYSILSPEGFASILYKDSSKYEEAAEKMKITASELQELNIIDEIIKEPGEGAHETKEKISNTIKKAILKNLVELAKLDSELLIKNRYEKYRKMGEVKI